MLRWLHERMNRHRWVELVHRHDVVLVDDAGEPATVDCYMVTECRCGTIRESTVTRSPIATVVPGLVLGLAAVSSKDLARLEDARAWATP